MTGARTGNIPIYSEKNRDKNEKTLEYLYQQIHKEQGSLSSGLLIEKLQKNDGAIEFAAIQKLVNMTLKYLIILNECEGTASVFDICEEKCDCPIDSIILERLNKINGNKHECWTKIEEPEYIKVQDEIRAYLREEYPQDTRGNIWFDFLMWKVN